MREREQVDKERVGGVRQKMGLREGIWCNNLQIRYLETAAEKVTGMHMPVASRTFQAVKGRCLCVSCVAGQKNTARDVRSLPEVDWRGNRQRGQYDDAG